MKAKRKVAETKRKVAASILIHDAADMTKRGKRQIANWLRKQAESLELDGKDYSARFRSAYYYVEGRA